VNLLLEHENPPLSMWKLKKQQVLMTEIMIYDHSTLNPMGYGVGKSTKRE